MKRIILIANNNNIDTSSLHKALDRLKIGKGDFVVRFNHATHKQVLNGRTDHYWLRAHKGGFWGLKEGSFINQIIGNNAKHIFYVSIDKTIDYIKHIAHQYRDIKHTHLDFNLIAQNLHHKYTFKTQKTPSTGLIAIEYYLKNYPNYEVILVGFDFHKGDRPVHDFDNERNYVSLLLNTEKRLYTLSSLPIC